MPDLPQELRALAADAAWPPTPDLAPAVMALLPAAPGRIPPRPARGARRPRRLVLAVVAALLLVPAAALAIPGPRHAILETLGLRHVEVQRREPPPRTTRDPRLGDRTTLTGAAALAGFAPLVPTALGPPDRTFVRGDIITMVYDREHLLLGQARGNVDRDVLRKVLGVDQAARRVRVDGRPGLFLPGRHAYAWFDATGPLVRSGPALIWERDGRVLRLEGEPSQRRAIRLAASAR
jgi:hypothetical protein